MVSPAVRDARAEAQALLPDGLQARVLEPSPPANRDPQWWADDPTDPGGEEGVVSPVGDGALSWADFADGDGARRAFAADRWLVPRDLGPLPTVAAATRDALHQLAYFVLSPRRFDVTGKLGLRWTRGGFGTPFHPTSDGDEQVRMEGDLLVVQTGDRVRSIRPTTIREAAQFVGVSYRAVWFDTFRDPLNPWDPDAPLEIDPEAAAAIGEWFGFGTSVLEELRRTPDAADVSRVQLWPEHFDPAVELGDAEAGQRASYGASPGDGGHPEPYLYVAAWSEVDRGEPFWNDTAFNGASLGFGELQASENPRAAALDFLRRGHELLTR